jgi:predicted phosphodiesterase
MGLKAVILPDVHIDDDGYDPVYEPVKTFIREFKPDVTVLLGDFADCAALSHWNLEKRRKVEGLRHDQEIRNLDIELRFLEKYSKKIVWLEGNHENWVEQYVDRSPETEGLLEYPNKLRLKERKITWIPQGGGYDLGKLFCIHGDYTSMHHAKKHLQTYGCNLCYGHTHTHQVHTMSMRTQDPYVAYGLGCLCNHTPSYLRGRKGAWINQFAVAYVANNGEFQLYPINIVGKGFYFEHKRYEGQKCTKK